MAQAAANLRGHSRHFQAGYPTPGSASSRHLLNIGAEGLSEGSTITMHGPPSSSPVIMHRENSSRWYEKAQPLCTGLLAVAAVTIAICLIIIAVSLGTLEKEGMQKMTFFAHAMPRLVGRISAEQGDGRLQFLDPSSPETSVAGKDRTEHLALVTQTMTDLGTDTSSLDEDGKLFLYTMALNTMRTEQILYNTNRLLQQTDVLLKLMGDDMVEASRRTLFEVQNLTYTVADYLAEVRAGKVALPVKLFG